MLLKVAFVYIFLTLSEATVNLGCPCSTSDVCKPVKTASKTDPEVYVFSRNTTNVHLWRWDTISTLIVPSTFKKDNLLQAEVLCFTHAKGKKFGITVDFDVKNDDNPGMFDNTTQSLVDAWLIRAVLKQKAWHADVLTVDLLKFFQTDTSSREEDMKYLAQTLFTLHRELKDTEMVCIVPWKPPCAKQDGSCDFMLLARDACSHFVLNSDSFLDTSGSKCIARANIPLSKLVYGISEYNAHHIPSDRIILGVSWHGNDYTCSSFADNVCSLEVLPPHNSTKMKQCLFNTRKRVTYGDIIRDYPLEYSKHEQNELSNAPFFNYKIGSTKLQVWFEDSNSLKSKYRLVHELNLKGIGILYGDDLSPTMIPNLLNNEAMMWSWVSHEIFLTTTKKPQHQDLHWADTVAGVAVGCFLLGVLLGVIFTCISMQKRIRKPRAPFRADMDPLGDEFTDDPDL